MRFGRDEKRDAETTTLTRDQRVIQRPRIETLEDLILLISRAMSIEIQILSELLIHRGPAKRKKL